MQSNKPDDPYILTDLLNSQKLLTNSYNNMVNNATNETFSADILAVLIEEHQIKTELVAEMSKRKLLGLRPADQNVIEEIRTTFCPDL